MNIESTISRAGFIALLGALSINAYAAHTSPGVTHNKSHDSHTYFRFMSSDWVSTPSVPAVTPQSVTLWGPQEFPNHTCSSTEITITEEKSTIDEVTVNGGVQYTTGVKATAGNELMGSIEATAQATLNLGAGWARKGEIKITVSQKKDQPKCTVYTHKVTANEYLASGTVSYFACKFMCSEHVSDPIVIYYCGDGTFNGDGKGHSNISRPWNESGSNVSPCPNCG